MKTKLNNYRYIIIIIVTLFYVNNNLYLTYGHIDARKNKTKNYLFDALKNNYKLNDDDVVNDNFSKVGNIFVYILFSH